jgi:hypothetical protein
MTVPRTFGRWLLAALAVQALWICPAWPQASGRTGDKRTGDKRTNTEGTGAEGPDANPLDVNLLDRRIAESVRGNPKLAGAWLFAIVDNQGAAAATPGKIVFRRVLDRARATEQRRELGKLIKTWLPAGAYVIDTARDREYPFSELIAELRIEVETDPVLGGCAIADAYYAPDTSEADKLDLVLRGRIAKEGQDVEIESLAGRLMRGEGAWVKAAAEGGGATAGMALAISPKTSKLKVVEPSESHGRVFYANGLNAFWKRQYPQAADSLRQATLESPRKIEYYYWWALADLAAGDAATAGRRMRTVVKRFREADFDRQSTEYRAVVRSLERVQGPLRRALLELESQALFADSQTRTE